MREKQLINTCMEMNSLDLRDYWKDVRSVPAGHPGPLAGIGKEGRYTATWKREFNLPWREAGPPKTSVDLDQ